MHKLTVAIFVGVLAVSSPAFAQGKGGGSQERSCGALPNASDHLATHEEVFQSATYAWFRDKYRISSLSDSDTRALVSNISVCGELVPHAEERFGSSFADSMYAVYKYGDYYVVEIKATKDPGEGVVLSGSNMSLMFYKVKNKNFITELFP